MTNTYKTARGKTIDMDKIKLANEQVTAVGNMKVNARGDKLGAGGKVIAGRNQVMDRVYAVDPANPLPKGGYSPNDPKEYQHRKAMEEKNKAKELHDLATNLVKPTSIEPEESQTTESENPPAARGSLASSVAKKAVVRQEPMPDPKKSNGPTRI
jgi:hypothetical protein